MDTQLSGFGSGLLRLLEGSRKGWLDRGFGLVQDAPPTGIMNGEYIYCIFHAFPLEGVDNAKARALYALMLNLEVTNVDSM